MGRHKTQYYYSLIMIYPGSHWGQSRFLKHLRTFRAREIQFQLLGSCRPSTDCYLQENLYRSSSWPIWLAIATTGADTIMHTITCTSYQWPGNVSTLACKYDNWRDYAHYCYVCDYCRILLGQKQYYHSASWCELKNPMKIAKNFVETDQKLNVRRQIQSHGSCLIILILLQEAWRKESSCRCQKTHRHLATSSRDSLSCISPYGTFSIQVETGGAFTSLSCCPTSL